MKNSNGPLSDLRIFEGSAFVAAPLGGLVLAQLGAEVIRFDQIGGGLDFGRWPLADENKSLFWTGLNRGKKSVELDLRSEAGRNMAADLITSPGENSGIFLTNLPAKDVLSYESLRKKRPDLIMVLLTGNYDGTSEVDYTVHPSFGYPLITGPKGSKEPVNSVLPTWDLVLGNMVAIAILAAERKRRMTGEGDLIKIALSDVALSVIGALGRLAQAYLGKEKIEPDGNFLYGAFGTNFITADNKQIMIVGLTNRQWKALKSALEIEEELQSIKANLDLEGERFKHREELAKIMAKKIDAISLAELEPKLNEFGVSWSKYQTFAELLKNDKRASKSNPIFNIENQPGFGMLPNVTSPIRFQKSNNLTPHEAPKLGEHTLEVIKDVLNKTETEIEDLILNQVIIKSKEAINLAD